MPELHPPMKILRRDVSYSHIRTRAEEAPFLISHNVDRDQ